MTDNDLHMFNAVLRRLREFRRLINDHRIDENLSLLGLEALADEIDWLDCYIERTRREDILREEVLRDFQERLTALHAAQGSADVG